MQGVGYRMEPVPEKTIAAALAARRGLSPEEAATAGSSKRRIIWEQEAEKTNIAYPHKEPAKAVRLKVGLTSNEGGVMSEVRSGGGCWTWTPHSLGAVLEAYSLGQS